MELSMESNDLKGIAVMITFLLALGLFQSITEAVDIAGFTNPDECTGASSICKGITGSQCCLLTPGAKQSVGFYDLTERHTDFVFHEEACNGRPAFSKQGPGGFCIFRAGMIDSARFILTHEPQACNSTVLPNAVMYSTPDSGASWVLETGSGKAQAVLEQLESVPDDQKVEWLQAAGAELNSHRASADLPRVGTDST